MKQYSAEIPGFAKALAGRVAGLKEAARIDEFSALKEAKPSLEKEFGCAVEVEKAESSKHPKARNAFPLKPAILLE